jgi:hypothetical protein
VLIVGLVLALNLVVPSERTARRVPRQDAFAGEAATPPLRRPTA